MTRFHATLFILANRPNFPSFSYILPYLMTDVKPNLVETYVKKRLKYTEEAPFSL